MKQLFLIWIACCGLASIANAQGLLPKTNETPIFGTADDPFDVPEPDGKQAIELLTRLLAETEDPLAKQTVDSQLQLALSVQYDQRMAQYEEHLGRLESQLQEMRQQLERRRSARDAMVDLRLQTIRAQANNLGWPSGSKNSGNLPGFPGDGRLPGLGGMDRSDGGVPSRESVASGAIGIGRTSNPFVDPFGGPNPPGDDPFGGPNPPGDDPFGETNLPVNALGNNNSTPSSSTQSNSNGPFDVNGRFNVTSSPSKNLTPFNNQNQTPTNTQFVLPQVRTANHGLKCLALEIQKYVQEYDEAPTNLADLPKTGRFTLVDPWGMNFYCNIIEKNSMESSVFTFYLSSCGPDKVTGNQDDITIVKVLEIESYRLMNVLRQVLLGMHNYESSYGQLPFTSKQTYDLGWQVKLLPYLGEGEQPLFDKFQHDQPWHNKVNRKLAEQRPDVLGGSQPAMVCWIQSDAQDFKTIKDGLSQTMAMLVVPNSLLPEPITWTESGGLTPSQVIEIFSKLKEGQSITVGFYDGSVEKLKQGDKLIKNLSELMTIDGGEILTQDPRVKSEN